MEDVHFRRTWATPFDIGWKAMAVNLSDIAGKGGRPLWALVGLALSAPAEPADVEALYEGMRQAGAPHGVAIVPSALGDKAELAGAVLLAMEASVRSVRIVGA